MVTRAWNSWQKFWFEADAALPMALFRIFCGLNLLLMYAIRHASLDVYYIADSPTNKAAPIGFFPEFFIPAWPLYPLVQNHVVLMHWFFLAAILLMTIGFFGRVAALFTLLLHVGFLQLNPSIVYGADTVNCFWLLFLAMAENDRVLSVRQRLLGEKLQGGWLSDALSSVALRFVQVQLCVIYGYTGLEKLKGASWWDGTAVWAVFGNTQLMLIDLSFLRSVPVLVGLMTFSTVLFEIYFPALIWIKKLRLWLLGFGVLLHAGIAIGMGLVFFSGAMLSAYFVFIGAELKSRYNGLSNLR